jgi:hypothetical protein
MKRENKIAARAARCIPSEAGDALGLEFGRLAYKKEVVQTLTHLSGQQGKNYL